MSNMQMIREWFILRFKRMPESKGHYFQEWLERFDISEENAINHMDKDSEKMWIKVLWAHGKTHIHIR